MPVDECIAHMAPNTATEDALLELYMTLSRAGEQLYLFDDIIAFIEWQVSTTFQKGDTLPHWATLIKQMADKHSVPPPDSMPVSLKIDANGIDKYCYCQEDVVTVQVWPFKQIMQEYLLDPFLFGNQSNLVNPGNPWEKYISSNPDDKEMLASYWYSKMWDDNITNPNTQFLVCLKAYIDKTGESARLTSYCGEPFPLSALHLKKSVWEQSGAWRVQADLPDLEAGSSAKKRKYSHSHKTCDRTNSNYHKVMQAVLQGGTCCPTGTCCPHHAY
jgi:hypothetical protein